MSAPKVPAKLSVDVVACGCCWTGGRCRCDVAGAASLDDGSDKDDCDEVDVNPDWLPCEATEEATPREPDDDAASSVRGAAVLLLPLVVASTRS